MDYELSGWSTLDYFDDNGGHCAMKCKGTLCCLEILRFCRLLHIILCFISKSFCRLP